MNRRGFFGTILALFAFPKRRQSIWPGRVVSWEEILKESSKRYAAEKELAMLRSRAMWRLLQSKGRIDFANKSLFGSTGLKVIPHDEQDAAKAKLLEVILNAKDSDGIPESRREAV